MVGPCPEPFLKRVAVSRIRLLAAVVVLSSAALAGQQPPPAGAPVPAQPDPQMPPITFRSEVNYVEVDAVVRDAQGNFVRDLRQGDFQVFEDGVPQTVTAFSLIDIPIMLSDRALFLPEDIEPDVRSNASGPEGRLYVLLLDDIHTDAMRSVRVRRAASQFIERNLGANDLAAVIHTSGRSDGAQDFTNSRRLLVKAVDTFMGRKLRSATLNKIDSYNLTRGGTQAPIIADAEQGERMYNARSLLTTLRSLSDWLAGIRGRRKAVVFISEGIDYNIWDNMGPSPVTVNGVSILGRGDGSLLVSEMSDVIAAATRANVSIYAIDPRGLYLPGDDAMQMSGLPADAEALGLGVFALQDELRRSQDTLRGLSEETGGFASVSSNDFATAFQRIVDANSTYYVLGYYSTNEKRDGRFRKIEVKLSRPGLGVNARKGYVAARGKAAAEKSVEASAGTSKELREALNSPLQESALKMAVFAVPLKGPASKAAIGVVTQFVGRQFAFTEKGGKFTDRLEMSYVAINSQGKMVGGKRDFVDLSLKPETYQRVLESGFRVLTRLELPPGTYQLRVAAKAGVGGTGSVHYDLVVPDFLKAPLGISGIVLTSRTAGAVPTAGAIPDLGDALPAPPTTARVFSTADELAVLAEVYDNQGAQSHSVDITATLKAEGRVQVFANSEQRSSKELGGVRGGYGYTTRIPLQDLAPGLYVLAIQAKSSLGGTGAVSREVQIRIVR
jgi:VWFA-related protein